MRGDDIVERLRSFSIVTWEGEEEVDPDCEEAAAEIERLRADNARLASFLHPIGEKARRG